MRLLCSGCVVWFIWIGSVVWSSAMAAKQDRACVVLYQQKQLREAAECFEAFSRKLRASLQPSTRLQLMRGRALRNAAMLFARFADSQSRAEVASYYRSRAARLLRVYLQEKLYEQNSRKKSATLLLYQLEHAIRYAVLVISPCHKRMSYQIKGYRFSKKGKDTWVGRIRPGTYLLSVFVPGRQAPVQRRITLAPEQREVVHLRDLVAGQKKAPVPDAQKRLLPWFVTGGGAAAMLLGGIVLAATVATVEHDKVAYNQDMLKRAPQMNEAQRIEANKTLNEMHGTSVALHAVSWTLIGLGVSALAVGQVLLFRQQFAKSTPMSPASKNTSKAVAGQIVTQRLLHRDL